MRCKYCGSKAIHSEEQRKDFSYGKALAGTIVFGPVGAVAGVAGKKVNGYRCAACGAYMDTPMDRFTEQSVNDAIFNKKQGHSSMYDYYKKQYPNIEDIEDMKDGSDTTIRIDRNVNKEREASISRNEELAEKRTQFYGLWDKDCPVYVSNIKIMNAEHEDRITLDAINQSEQTIRSVYYYATAYDDTGDELITNQCVYQGIKIQPGEKLPESTQFGLGTTLAYTVKLYCEKVAFENGDVWRAADNCTAEQIILPEEINPETFPRYKYAINDYREKLREQRPIADEKDYKALRARSAWVSSKHFKYIPEEHETYWLCTCGTPTAIGKKCPNCGLTFEQVSEVFSQKRLEEIQRKAVFDRAEQRAKETLDIRKRAEDVIEKETEDKYQKALSYKNKNTLTDLEEAKNLFTILNGYKDSSAKVQECIDLINDYRIKEEEKRKQEERKAAEERAKRIKLYKKISAIAIPVIICLVIFFSVIQPRIARAKRYNEALDLLQKEKYTSAVSLLETTKGYKDTEKLLEEAQKGAKKEKQYNAAKQMMDNGEYNQAEEKLKELGNFRDSEKLAKEAHESNPYYKLVQYVCENGQKYSDNYISGLSVKLEMPDYKDNFDQKIIANEESTDKVTVYVKYIGNEKSMAGWELRMEANGKTGNFDIKIPMSVDGKNYEANAKGSIDISTYEYGDSPSPQQWSLNGGPPQYSSDVLKNQMNDTIGGYLHLLVETLDFAAQKTHDKDINISSLGFKEINPKIY